MIPGALIKVFLPAVLSFVVGIGLTAWLTRYFYTYKLWKRKSRHVNTDEMSPVFHQIHNEEAEVNTPRVGGVIIWLSVLLTTLIIWIIAKIGAHAGIGGFEFVSRGQTWLPLITLIFGGLFGLAEDFFEIFGSTGRFGQGIPKWFLVSTVAVIGLACALWFYFKLGVHDVYIPFVGYTVIGWLFIPFFVIVVLGTFSSRVIDGIDGLAAGVMAVAYASYAMIALLNNQVNLAAFCFVVTGAILSFLWFNIPPARYYMGETGMLGLTLTLAIVAFLTDNVFVLPVIAIMLMLTSLSSAIQITSKKYFKRKVFRIAPLHNNFLALGWSRERITMRYWIISLMAGVVGIIIAILG
jgi:phospho-N-acetylmuramoyl-pentapeptide-transferase